LQRRLIQLATETKIQKLGQPDSIIIDQINKSNEELIASVDEYEKKCKQDFKIKNVSIKQALEKLVEDANRFLEQKLEWFLMVLNI